MYPAIAQSPPTYTMSEISDAEYDVISVENPNALIAENYEGANYATLGPNPEIDGNDDFETIIFENIDGTNLQNIKRGVEGIARYWPENTPIARYMTSNDLNDLQANVRNNNILIDNHRHNANQINDGILAFASGGTGINTIQQGQILLATWNNILAAVNRDEVRFTNQNLATRFFRSTRPLNSWETFMITVIGNDNSLSVISGMRNALTLTLAHLGRWWNGIGAVTRVGIDGAGHLLVDAAGAISNRSILFANNSGGFGFRGMPGLEFTAQATEPPLSGGQWQSVNALVWTNVIMQNGWVAHSTMAPRFRKTSSGIVLVEGYVSRGPTVTDSNSAMFSLPAGFRPGRAITFGTTTWSSPNMAVNMNIMSSGFVHVSMQNQQLAANLQNISIQVAFLAEL